MDDHAFTPERVAAEARRYNLDTLEGHDTWQAVLKAKLAGMSWSDARRIGASIEMGVTNGYDLDSMIEMQTR